MANETSNLVCFAVNCHRGPEASQMCLSSVLLGIQRPEVIVVNFNGPIPSFGSFYLEQLADLARHFDVDLNIKVSPNEGVRKARQRLLEEAARYADLVWMGDDDVIYEPACLHNLMTYYRSLKEKPIHRLYVQGSKPDLNNRRSYADFRTSPITADELARTPVEERHANMFYSTSARGPYECKCFDTGNVMFDAAYLLKENFATFDPFEDSANAGGEDTLFGAMLRKNHYTGFLIPNAIGYHLESPVKAWGVMSERGEAVLRSAQLLNIDTDDLKKTYAPWVFKKP